jgi:hypothetical protein
MITPYKNEERCQYITQRKKSFYIKKGSPNPSSQSTRPLIPAVQFFSHFLQDMSDPAIKLDEVVLLTSSFHHPNQDFP